VWNFLWSQKLVINTWIHGCWLGWQCFR
jgi:hypothetical protein